jgi:hypothetical protein
MKSSADFSLELSDNLEKHFSYYRVMNEYSGTELFKEIIHFMEMSFPEWKSNNGIGFCAPEFILNSIEFLTECISEQRHEDLRLKSLKLLYVSVAEDYERFKIEYKSIFLSIVLVKFNEKFEEELEDEFLSDFRYNDLYDTFLKKELEKVAYNFNDEIIV